MNVFVNEKVTEVVEGISLQNFLCQLDLPTKHYAVEINLMLIPRDEHATHLLQEGDRIEVVTLVGGG